MIYSFGEGRMNINIDKEDIYGFHCCLPLKRINSCYYMVSEFLTASAAVAGNFYWQKLLVTNIKSSSIYLGSLFNLTTH
jgi:hypothetical protein